MMNQNSSGTSKKVKKRASRQPKVSLDKILNEDDDSLFNEGFQIDSDNVSPNNTSKKSSPIKEEKNKKNANIEINGKSITKSGTIEFHYQQFEEIYFKEIRRTIQTT